MPHLGWLRLFPDHCIEAVIAKKRYYLTCMGGGGGCVPTLAIYASRDNATAAASRGPMGSTGEMLKLPFGEQFFEGGEDREQADADRLACDRALGEGAFANGRAYPEFMKLIPSPGSPMPRIVTPLTASELMVCAAAVRIVAVASDFLRLRTGRKPPSARRSRWDDFMFSAGSLDADASADVVWWRHPPGADYHLGECYACERPRAKFKCSGCKAIVFCGRRC